ncbi:hypothetical protein [Thiocystis violascens]|uniref:Uncharacterized protein n=1 Tax=Thiocystis violascens (strain ATCC 17096 / DSM 198 / 6111) TaxID=765911 RepID=I3Y8W4_THIV6|nr:hypothetical protein [Thiocystis violascens]AFL73432.1 hypothetical protein Thivi_1426 [Thiocystis violascens DSM 198]
MARNTVSNVRAGRASLGPRPRLRILNQFAPFDTKRVDAVLESTDALIQAVQEGWIGRAGQQRRSGTSHRAGVDNIHMRLQN